MDSFTIPYANFSLGNSFCDSFDDYAFFACNILWLIFCAGFISILYIAYKKVRRKFPIKVNCWFCNENTSIPYELSSGWNCPSCEQYNGFNQDGDYNKIIPEQFNHKMNEDIFKTVRSSVDAKGSNFQNNGFCKLCNINQQLKVQQLALFVPLNEDKYYEEVEQYREKLEKAYKLCSKCEKTLQETIEKQEYNLMQNRLNNHKTNSFSNQVKNLKREQILALLKNNGFLLINFVKIIIAVLIPVILLIQFEKEHHYLNLSSLDWLSAESLIPVFEVLSDTQNLIHIYIKEFAAAGFFCSFLTLLHNNQNKSNHINLLIWGLLYLSLWTLILKLHILISAVCLFMNRKKKQIYLKRKSLTKKSAYQPDKEVLPETFTNLRDEKFNESIGLSIKQEISSIDDEDIDIAPKIIEKVQKRKKNEAPSVCTEPGVNNSLGGDSNETNGPFNEVYNTLNNLKLGEKHKKSNKSPNFLFANHNFSEKGSSIIKPGKFIKNLNSTSYSESNECNSRSSTPSSIYSGQKPIKVDTNRYNFSKTMSPISPFNRNFFDCYDNTNGFYNNPNCFGFGFVPFQQFPGHTALFTCTRPAFAPWQGYPNQSLSPNRFSDASDLDNIFQESSKKFEQSKKWLKLKSFFYNISLVLNVITITSLIYFTSTGVILLDWKLPKFDFFL